MAHATTSRPGLTARDEVAQLAAPDLVMRLRDILGARLLTYLAGELDAGVLGSWIEGLARPSDDVLARLRVAFVAASILRAVEGKATVQSWFQGINPQLGEHAPAQLIRDEPIHEVGPKVEGAAQTAASVG